MESSACLGSLFGRRTFPPRSLASDLQPQPCASRHRCSRLGPRNRLSPLDRDCLRAQTISCLRVRLVITITRHSRILRPRCLTGPNACKKSLFSLLSSPRIAHPTARHSACPSQSFHVAQGLSLFLGPDAFCRESPQAFLSALAVICVWRLPACPLATASSLFHLSSPGFGGTFQHPLQS